MSKFIIMIIGVEFILDFSSSLFPSFVVSSGFGVVPYFEVNFKLEKY